MTIGERIAEIRKDNGYTQQTLGDKLGVSKYTVSSWEKGISHPSLVMLKKLCEILNISSDYILGLIEYDITYERTRKQALYNHQELLEIRKFEEFILFKRQ